MTSSDETGGRNVASLGYFVKIQSSTWDFHVLLIQKNWGHPYNPSVKHKKIGDVREILTFLG